MLQAIKALETLLMVSTEEVTEHGVETADCITSMLDMCKRTGKQLPDVLHAASTAAKTHPRLWSAFQNRPTRALLLSMFEAVAADAALYTNYILVLKLSAAQYRLGVYSPKFWETISHPDQYKCREVWDAWTAANVVCAYGKLHSTKVHGKQVAPKASSTLKKVLFDIVKFHAPKLAAQGVGTVAWSLAKQGWGFEDALVPLRHRIMQTAKHMKLQHISNTLWAFTTAKEDLGGAKVPLLECLSKTVAEVNAKPRANSGEAQNVSNILWACTKMNLDLSDELKHTLMEAVCRVAPLMNAQNVANTLWALAQLRIPRESAHDRLIELIPKVSKSSKLLMRNVRQMVVGLKWLQEQGHNDSTMQQAVKCLHAAEKRLKKEH